MSRLTGWKAGVIAVAFAAWPIVAAAQGTQQSGQQGQQPPTQGSGTQQAQPTNPQQPPQSSGQGFGQGQGQADSVRQQALSHLTAARQDLADITKLPAAGRIQGQARNDLNELISNFNALITSTGPEWREAYDKVQAKLSALVGPPAGEPGQSGQSAVGTSGSTAASSLDPSIVAKLNDMRQHVDQFGETVGVKPGQSAVAAQSGGQPGAAGTSGASGTSAAAPNEQALRNVDQIGEIVTRALSQGSPDQPTVSVSRQDLQQIQQFLTQLRQALGGSGIR